MTLNVETMYHITSGQLQSYTLKPYKVSKCGQFGWFVDPSEEHLTYRVHVKHLSTKEPERTIEVCKNEEVEAMASLHVKAHAYVTSENLKRIEKIKATLEERLETNMAEVEAIAAGTRVTDNVERLDFIVFALFLLALLITSMVF